MLLRLLPLLIALLLLGRSSQVNAALFVAAPSTSSPPSMAENASTAFFESGSESRIGLLCHNDPVNKSDPTGEAWWLVVTAAIAFFSNADIANAPETPETPTPRSAGMIGMVMTQAAGPGKVATVGKGTATHGGKKLLDSMTNKATSPKSPIKPPTKADFQKTKIEINKKPAEAAQPKPDLNKAETEKPGPLVDKIMEGRFQNK